MVFLLCSQCENKRRERGGETMKREETESGRRAGEGGKGRKRGEGDLA